MSRVPLDIVSIQRLRGDVALQLARYTHRMDVTESVAARRLSLPQPTLSKIIVSGLSLELLIRVAIRAGLAGAIQMLGKSQGESGEAGHWAEALVEAGFFVSTGAVNPSLTIMANDLRVGDHLLQRMH